MVECVVFTMGVIVYGILKMLNKTGAELKVQHIILITVILFNVTWLENVGRYTSDFIFSDNLVY